MKLNIKTILFLCIVFYLAGCSPNRKSTDSPIVETGKKIEVLVNRNEVAFRIAHHLAVANKGWVKPNPVRDTLAYYFSDFENHPVIQTLRNDDYIYDDVLSQYLLHQKEFPEFGNLYNDSHIIEEMALFGYAGMDTLYARIYSELFDFYNVAKVDVFLGDMDFWYQGALSEIESAASQYDVIQQMEEYCRMENYRYVVSPEPLFLTGGYRGIGPTIYTENGRICYQIISPSPDINLEDVDYTVESPQYGYSDNAYIRNIMVHEFGHSFVELDLGNSSIQNFVDKKGHLFTKAVQETLNGTGIGSFHTYVLEHIVRLLEIRIAEKYLDAGEAQKLREENAAFIWLPQMEKLIIKEYESKPNQYRTLTSFIPQLLTVVE